MAIQFVVNYIPANYLQAYFYYLFCSCHWRKLL